MSVLAKNYEIIKELGRGGAGSVYLAHDKKLDRQVAIKMLELDSNLDLSLIHEMQQRFEKEAKAIARLNHPNIVDIYDFGEENGKHFMVIELLNGESLSSQIYKVKSLPIEKILEIGLQLCSAVSYAHSQGVIHRDIKPANIMILDNYKVKLTDFGIAQLHNDKLALTQAGSILGSILYIPPEQLVDSRKVDKRADVYSLGVTIFQLLTGRLPFEGNSVAEVVTKILNQDIPSMLTFNKEIPEALDRVILKAIKKEPEERYQNIEDFASALKDIKDYLKTGNSTSQKIVSNTKPINNSKSKNENKSKSKFILPLTILFLVLGLGGYLFSQSGKNNNLNKIKSSTTVTSPKAVKPSNKVITKTPIPQKVKTPLKAISTSKPVKNVVNPAKKYPVQKYNKPVRNTVTPVKTIRKVSPQAVYITPKKVNRPVVRKPSTQLRKAVTKPIKKPTLQTKKSIGEGY